MNTLKHDCTDQEHHDWVLENQKHAGGFHYNLIEAWKRADGENKRRLEEAFPYDYRIPLGKPIRKRSEMTLLTAYCKIKDELEVLTYEGDGYNHDACLWDIEGYYDCGIDDEDILRERVEALENLAKAIERVNNTEIVYS